MQPLKVTRVTPCLDMRRHLADTGASVSATGLLSILYQFLAGTMYEIVGYDGTFTKTAGQGIAQVYHAATRTTEPMLLCSYQPSQIQSFNWNITRVPTRQSIPGFRRQLQVITLDGLPSMMWMATRS